MIITLILSISLIIVIVLQYVKYNKDKKKQIQNSFFKNHSEKLNSIDMQSFRIISENSIIINF